MRLSKSIAFAAVLVATSALPAGAAESWTGWITETHCGAAGAKAEHKACAEKCHKQGAALVFFNSADKKLYQIDQQEAALAQLGHEVQVTGTLDGDAIQVESIEPTK